MDRLHRTRLLFGDDGVQKLQEASVMVVGCGAVGSFAIEALARTGVGHLIIVDMDTVAESNINRQLIATDTALGLPKVGVMAVRIDDINPDTRVDALNMRWDAETDLEYKPDYVIDAIDDVAGKIALYKWCQKNNIPFISSMGAARKTDPAQIKIARLSQTSVCPLAAKIRSATRDAGLDDFSVVFSTEPAAPQSAPNKEFGSLITVTGTFGLYAANWVIQKIVS